MILELAFVGGVAVSLAFALFIAGIAIVIFTRNIYLSLLTMLIMLLIIISIIGMFVTVGWTLGAIEALCMSFVVGLSVDYVLHLGNAYNEAHAKKRIERTQSALREIGASIVAASFTTIASMSILLMCEIQIFNTVGWIVIMTVALAMFYSLGVFMSLLTTVGPEDDGGNISKKNLVACPAAFAACIGALFVCQPCRQCDADTNMWVRLCRYISKSLKSVCGLCAGGDVAGGCSACGSEFFKPPLRCIAGESVNCFEACAGSLPLCGSACVKKAGASCPRCWALGATVGGAAAVGVAASASNHKHKQCTSSSSRYSSGNARDSAMHTSNSRIGPAPVSMSMSMSTMKSTPQMNAHVSDSPAVPAPAAWETQSESQSMSTHIPSVVSHTGAAAVFAVAAAPAPASQWVAAVDPRSGMTYYGR
jgi:hypothetical protein